jgi:uncharacterized LabA/DUF88 family protein
MARYETIKVNLKNLIMSDKESNEVEVIEKSNVYVFIDASNLWQVQKAKGKLFDYQKLRNFIKTKFNASSNEIFYYSAYPAEGTRDYSLDGRHRFFTFLKKGLKFIVRKKKLKRISIITPEGELIEEKGNMDVEITIDALHHIEKYDIAVFFTGDSDFLALVTYLHHRGKKVYIFSSKNNISQELRTVGDGYFDILKIEEDIWRGELKFRLK